MKTIELTTWLEQQYPCEAAEEWDNVGLLTGEDTGEVLHVYLALDLTDDVLEAAINSGADFILTHHPMIFKGIRKINNHSFTGRRILRLIQNGIAYYAMHTNFDILGMAELSSRRMKLKNARPLSITKAGGEAEAPEGLGRTGELEKEMTFARFALFVKEAFGLESVRAYGDPDTVIRTAAICTGSGKSLLPEVLSSGADAYVTGDIDHHTGIDAVADGLCVVDAGHYGTEYMFMDAMEEKLSEAFPELIVSKAPVREPYLLV